MGYMHINNLYRDQTVLMFKEVYAMEKVHGTSTHIAYQDGEIRLFAGGADHLSFTNIFDVPALLEQFKARQYPAMTIYGEGFGGKMQGMRETYGDKLRFVAFDVKIGQSWLEVPKAEEIVRNLGLDFMPYERGPATVEWLDEQRDRPSRVAVKPDCISEGIVIRPILEWHRGREDNRHRVIAKHKRPEFSERASKKDTRIDPEKAELLAAADAIAVEWVTPMRMEHVIDNLRAQGVPIAPESTRLAIDAMIADVRREAAGEILESKAAMKAIGAAAAKLFKASFRVPDLAS